MSDSLIDTTLWVLNNFFEKDPEACRELFARKVIVNDELAHDTVLMCRERKGGKHEIGILTVINGIMISAGGQPVAILTDADGEMVGFSKYKPVFPIGGKTMGPPVPPLPSK